MNISTYKSTSSFSESVEINNIGNYYNRFIIYNKAIKNIINIDKFQCLVNKSNNEFTIGNSSILLKKRVGSNSRYGLIYLSINDKFKYATKLTPINKYNYNEIIIAKKLSDIVLNDINPHFLIIYKFFICNNDLEILNLPKLIKNNDYYISINELVSGNLKKFFDGFYITNELLINALQQIILSILSFHHFSNDLFHNDCHYKNFLFHKIQPGGYFHYNIYGKDVYIKNMGYLWIIWDFGLVKSGLEYSKRKLEDYFRIIPFFNKYNSNYYDSSSNIIQYVKNILKIKYNNNFKGSDKLFINEVFKIPNLFLFNIPNKSKIVNKKTYIIN